MELWGKIGKSNKRNHWYVKGRWQGKRLYFSQIPALRGFLKCESEKMAQYLQVEISKEMENGTFNPAKYKRSKPLHMEKYAIRWLELKKPNLAYATWKGYRSYINNWIILGLGDEYLPDLNHHRLLQFFNGINRSVKHKKNIQGLIHEMLEDARKSGYINQLPEMIKFRWWSSLIVSFFSILKIQ